MSSNPDLPTVAHVDIPRYMGDWYVIANLPLPVEGDLVNTMESYHWNEKEQRIDVDFRGRKETPDGKLKAYPQKAFIHNKETNAEWRVQFFWPLKFPYLILDLDEAYSYTIVGVPNRKYLWIMSRTPTMSAEIFAARVEKAKALGFDVSKLRTVPQVWK